MSKRCKMVNRFLKEGSIYGIWIIDSGNGIQGFFNDFDFLRVLFIDKT